MRNNIVLILFVFFPIFFNNSVVFAESTGLNGNRLPLDEIKERIASRQALIQERMEEIKAKNATNRAEFKERLSQSRKIIIRDYFTRMTKKISNALVRQEKLSNRISSRLSKLKANGKDVSALETRLSQINSLIEETKLLLEKTKNKLEDVLSSSDPKAAFKEIKDLIKSISDKVKEIHALLVDVINSMKGMSETIKLQPSPTIKISTQSGGTRVNILTQSGNSRVKIDIQSNTNVSNIITISP